MTTPIRAKAREETMQERAINEGDIAIQATLKHPSEMANFDIDAHKLMYHPERVIDWYLSGDSQPLYVEIGLTNRCNHRCVFCALDFLGYKNYDIDTRTLLRAYKSMKQCGVKSIMFGGEGEPLLHPSYDVLIAQARHIYGFDVALTTNGVLFDRTTLRMCLPQLSWIRFSLDAGTPETYAKVHRTKTSEFDKVIDNIATAVEIRKQLKLDTAIQVQFVMIPQNIRSLGKLIQILEETEIDNLQVKPYSHHPESRNDFTVTAEDYQYAQQLCDSTTLPTTFREETIKRINEGNVYPQCYGLSFITLITAKADVLPCNLFYDKPAYVYGNLSTDSFEQIWHSQRRQDIMNSIKVNKCRKGCRLDAINKDLECLKNPKRHDIFMAIHKYLECLKNPKPHDNFI